jgi:hypothetical protein
MGANLGQPGAAALECHLPLLKLLGRQSELATVLLQDMVAVIRQEQSAVLSLDNLAVLD